MTNIFLLLFLSQKKIPTLFLPLGFFILNPSSNSLFCLKNSCSYCLGPSFQPLSMAFLDNLNTYCQLFFYDTWFNRISFSTLPVCITVITLHVCLTLDFWIPWCQRPYLIFFFLWWVGYIEHLKTETQ